MYIYVVLTPPLNSSRTPPPDLLDRPVGKRTPIKKRGKEVFLLRKIDRGTLTGEKEKLLAVQMN